MKYKTLLILCFFNFTYASIDKEITSLKKELKLTAKDRIGLSILENDHEVISRNKETKFIPASTFKMVSAYYILETLGANHKFTTKLGYNGKLENGVLHGDLILSPSGDPYLLTSDLVNMALSVRLAGITEIKGSLIISSDFPSLNRIGNVGLDDQPYNQGVSALNVNFNRFKAIKSNAISEAFPKHDFFKYTQTKTNSPGEVFKRVDTKNKEHWKASRLSKYFYEVPIRDTLMYNAHYFLRLLADANIVVPKNLLLQKKESSKLLYKKESESVLKLVKLAMEYSNNLFIETLSLKASGKKDLKEAANSMKLFYKKNFPSLNIHKLNFSNTSGLSLELKLKPRTLAKFLKKVSMKRYNDSYFISLLSLAGNGGFLAKKFLNDRTHLKFFAKTGSLDFVNGICGQSIRTKKSFCLFINNFNKRNQLQGKNSQSQEKLRQEAKGWKRKTDKALQRIISLIYSKQLL